MPDEQVVVSRVLNEDQTTCITCCFFFMYDVMKFEHSIFDPIDVT